VLAILIWSQECERFKELAAIFEFTQLVEPVMASITETLEDLALVKDVWDTAMLCELQFSDWRETLWNDIRTDLMEDGAKQFIKEVKGLNKKVRGGGERG
jgi:dynein heavy chain